MASKSTKKETPKCPKGHELVEAKGMLHCSPCKFWQNPPMA